MNMRFAALACDYDGTLACDGRVDRSTLRALERVRRSGCKLLLVTGRELADLASVFPHLELFDRVVAENGALLYDPAIQEQRLLAGAPPRQLIQALRAHEVEPLSVGEAVLATSRAHAGTAAEVIRELGLAFRVILNKRSAMVLPAAVHKGTGLSRAALELGIGLEEIVGVGDAENDQEFLALCGYAVAVANALPQVKRSADLVTNATHGAGVVELIDTVLLNGRGNSLQG